MPASYYSVRNALSLLLAAIVILWAVSPAATAESREAEGETPVLHPLPVHAETARDIVRQLEREHYVSLRVDSDMSERLFENYLSLVDPNRLFLLQSDVDEFAERRNRLDREIKGGNLETGFAIYNRYLQRSIERIRGILADLEETVEGFDFSGGESVELDRSEMPWPADEAAADELWHKQLKNRALSLKLSGQDTESIVEQLERRYRNQLNRLEQSSQEDVFQTYMNALATLYDPHTSYYTPRRSENFQIDMSLRLEGIGAVLQSDDEYTRVVRLVPAGPADRQGDLQPADRIVAVAEDDEEFKDVIGWRLDDVVDLIRGPKGTRVRLQVIPVSAGTEDERREIAIERNEVKLEEQSARKRMLHIPDEGEGDDLRKIGVIEIPTFYMDFEAMRRGDPDYRSTTRDVQQLLDELLAEGAEGIIIDLRNNGGGSLSEANALAGLFIQSGPTVQIRYANSWVKREGKRRHTPYYDGPLAVMINRLSASASEIFAGAIQDYQRGLVIGNPSFGKGTVQSINQLSHGQLKLTESKFYRISGKSTQHKGVIPDIVFPSIHDEERVGESALDNAMEWDTIASIPFTPYFDISGDLPRLKEAHRERIAEDPDFNYLREQIEHVASDDQESRVSLNLEERRAAREKRREVQLAMENKRRVAKGLKPLEELSDDTASEIQAAAAERERRNREEDPPDPMLIEAGFILVDAIPTIYNNQRMAKSKPSS